MARKPASIHVSQQSAGDDYEYCIMQIKNLLGIHIGEVLTSDKLQALMDLGVNVTITAPNITVMGPDDPDESPPAS